MGGEFPAWWKLFVFLIVEFYENTEPKIFASFKIEELKIIGKYVLECWREKKENSENKKKKSLFLSFPISSRIFFSLARLAGTSEKYHI